MVLLLLLLSMMLLLNINGFDVAVAVNVVVDFVDDVVDDMLCKKASVSWVSSSDGIT